MIGHWMKSNWKQRGFTLLVGGPCLGALALMLAFRPFAEWVERTYARLGR
jgi:hypothetical protein